MSKKRKALQVSALLSAVSGATLIMSASAPVQAAETNRVEERCWDQERTATTTQYRMYNCKYNQYGLKPGDGGLDKGYNPDDAGTGGGGGGPSGGGDYPTGT
ncbi:hypothetical protein [Aestuariivirga sp.]|uniref:hypothetical protein n=1 Tax=Aestuariivirga sp. TaxID=2650926 RepID=UPI0035B1A455